MIVLVLWHCILALWKYWLIVQRWQTWDRFEAVIIASGLCWKGQWAQGDYKCVVAYVQTRIMHSILVFWSWYIWSRYKISLCLVFHFMYFSCCLLFYRLFGGKPSKQVPITTAENMKNSVVISNPHATMNQQGNLDSPSGSGVLSSGGSSPLYGKSTDLNQSPLASSPSSAHSAPSNSLTWGTNASSSSAVSKDGIGYQSVSSLHTSCESIDISLSSGGGLSRNSSSGLIPASKDDSLTPFVRTNSVKTTLSERLVSFFCSFHMFVSQVGMKPWQQ